MKSLRHRTYCINTAVDDQRNTKKWKRRNGAGFDTSPIQNVILNRSVDLLYLSDIIRGSARGSLKRERKSLQFDSKVSQYCHFDSHNSNRFNGTLASIKLPHRVLIKQYDFPTLRRNVPVRGSVICDRQNETEQLQQNGETVRVFPVLLE